jgi:hypothetical protein
LTTHPHDSLASLTRQYARYSLTAGGLASVIGGGLTIIAYFAGAIAPPEGLPGRIALASAPLIWIGAKELLRRHYYQRFGRVSQVRTLSERRWHLFFTLVTALVSVVVVGAIVLALGTGRRGVPADPGMVGYVVFVGAMPLLVWYFMRTPLEFIIGVFLVAQAGLALAGVHYELGDQLQAPVAGLVLMVIGVKQHLEFRTLDRSLRQMDDPAVRAAVRSAQ